MSNSRKGSWSNTLINKIGNVYHLHCTAYDARTTAELMGHDNLERGENTFISRHRLYKCIVNNVLQLVQHVKTHLSSKSYLIFFLTKFACKSTVTLD